MPTGAAHDPSGFVVDLGKGRIGKARRVAILERHDGHEWQEAGRFESLSDANRELDEALANGASPDSLRVLQTSGVSSRLLLIAGSIAIAAAFGIALYILFG